MTQKNIFYDRFYNLFLFSNIACCNHVDIPELRTRFAALDEKCDAVNIMTHEQYSYPDYFNYIPNHLDRIEEACRLAHEQVFIPVWFTEGLLGNKSWEK